MIGTPKTNEAGPFRRRNMAEAPNVVHMSSHKATTRPYGNLNASGADN
jgi:hypothetical protein